MFDFPEGLLSRFRSKWLWESGRVIVSKMKKAVSSQKLEKPDMLHNLTQLELLEY